MRSILGCYVALPTVRAENFCARPAHSRQRKTSSGRTRILTQRGNKLSKLRTVQNSPETAWTTPEHKNCLCEKSKCLKIHGSPCEKKNVSGGEGGLLVYFTSSPWIRLPNRLCRHSPYFWQCDKPPVSLTFSPPSVSLLPFSLSPVRLLFSTPPPSTLDFVD